MARRERRDNQHEKDQAQDRPELEGDEPERESVAALKGILTKCAALVKPLGLTPQEASGLVQEMYEHVLDLDSRLVGESEHRRKHVLTAHIAEAEVRREDDRIVVQYPETPPLAASAGTSSAEQGSAEAPAGEEE